MGLAHSPRIVTDSLVLLLDAVNVKSYPGSGTTWTDLSVSKANGTLTNSPTFNSSYFSFDGSDKYVEGDLTTIAAGSNVTVEAVIRLNNVSGLKCILCQGRSAVSFGYGLVVSDTAIRFRNSSNDHAFPSPTTLQSGSWYHVAITTNASGSVGYVNGVSQGSIAQITNTNAITDYVVGRRSGAVVPAAGEYMNGDISFVRVYYKTLTEVEILRNFNAIRGRYGI